MLIIPDLAADLNAVLQTVDGSSRFIARMVGVSEDRVPFLPWRDLGTRHRLEEVLFAMTHERIYLIRPGTPTNISPFSGRWPKTGFILTTPRTTLQDAVRIAARAIDVAVESVLYDSEPWA